MPSPRTPYLEPAKLAALVRESRRLKRVTDELGAALLLIAGGVWDRYHFTSDRDEFTQDVVLHLIQRPLAKADTRKGNLFNYFTTCAIRFGNKLRSKSGTERRRFETYAAELVESGRQIPNKYDSFSAHDISDDVDPKGHIESDRGAGRIMI